MLYLSAKHEAPRRPDARSWTTESQAYLSQRFKSRMNKKRQTVAKLIEKFESHKFKEQFLQDMSQTQKINRFSEASQKLPKDLNQTEIFELEFGIIYCRCGRNLKHNRSGKAICMKTKDQLYQRENLILRARVDLKANSQCDSQDLLVQEARSSLESKQDAESYGETRSNTADHRILGISM